VKKILVLLAPLLAVACAAAPELRPAPEKKASAEAQPACQATPRELVVKDLQEGEGRPLIPRSSVMVQYTGWLFDGCKPDLKGNMFDTSTTRPAPFGFMVGAGRVIKGWDEGVLGMKEKKHKRLLVIPADKAYGEKGAGNVIPPNAALVFEIETVGIGYYPVQSETPK
jgi:FKBP-type peptidyl-prolyl cis-trans isomerase FkpA